MFRSPLVRILLTATLVAAAQSASASVCPIDRPLDGVTHLDLFRGIVSSIDVVGTMEQGGSYDIETKDFTPSHYELLEIAFEVTDDYSGVGGSYILQRRGDYIQPTGSNSTSHCRGCPEDHDLGESYFVVVDRSGDTPQLLSCHGGYDEERVAEFSRTGTDPSPEAVRACGTNLFHLARPSLPETIDTLERPDCRAELARMRDGTKQGVAALASNALEVDTCRGRARTQGWSDIRACADNDWDTGGHCSKDAREREEAASVLCPGEASFMPFFPVNDATPSGEHNGPTPNNSGDTP